MNSTVILLNNGFGHLEQLSQALKYRGKNVTIFAPKGCNVEPSVCDKIIYSKDIYCSKELSALVEQVKTKENIELIVNNSAALTFVHYELLKKYGDLFGCSNWILNAHVKAECRRILNYAGVSKVNYVVIKNASELESVKQNIRYPAVIKPVMGQGSECVFKVHNASELSARYEQTRNVLVKGVSRNENYDIYLNGNRYNLSSDVMVEEYINGVEFTVDGYIQNSKATIAAVHQKFFGIEENGFRDRFYITPPEFWDDVTQTSVQSVVNHACRALNMDNALFHIEMRRRGNNFEIIEVNPRLGGGTIQENVFLSTGISLIDVFADILCSQPAKAIAKNFCRIVYDFGLTMPKSGKVLQIKGLDELRLMPAVSNIQLNIKPGDIIEEVMGEKFVLFCNGIVNSHEDAFNLYRCVNDTIKLEII